MSIPLWRRPWLDGAEEHYREEEEPEPPERDEEYEKWLDDFDRRVDDMYSDRTELPDGDCEPY